MRYSWGMKMARCLAKWVYTSLDKSPFSYLMVPHLYLYLYLIHTSRMRYQKSTYFQPTPHPFTSPLAKMAMWVYTSWPLLYLMLHLVFDQFRFPFASSLLPTFIPPWTQMAKNCYTSWPGLYLIQASLAIFSIPQSFPLTYSTQCTSWPFWVYTSGHFHTSWLCLAKNQNEKILPHIISYTSCRPSHTKFFQSRHIYLITVFIPHTRPLNHNTFYILALLPPYPL